MKVMLIVFFITFSQGLALAESGGQRFQGNFSQVESADDLCADIYSELSYDTKHFRVGPTRLHSVLYFNNADKKGFFHEMTLLGDIDNVGEFAVEKKFKKNDHYYQVKASGLVNNDFIYVEAKVLLFAEEYANDPLCTAYAEYTGFPFEEGE